MATEADPLVSPNPVGEMPDAEIPKAAADWFTCTFTDVVLPLASVTVHAYNPAAKLVAVAPV
jgi:hypothetical protein